MSKMPLRAEPQAPVRRQSLPPRPQITPPRPAALPQLNQSRVIRREAVRQVANQAQPGVPRPVVRPAASPLKAMPRVPTPPTAAARPRPTLGHVLSRPSSATPSPAVAAAGAAAGTVAASMPAVNTANAQAEIAAEVNALQSSLAQLQSRSLFGDIQSEIDALGQLLDQISQLLESARQKGYQYAGDLDETVYTNLSQWQSLQGQVSSQVSQQASLMQTRLLPLNNQLSSLNASLGRSAAALHFVRGAQSQVNTLLAEIMRIEASLRQNYQTIDTTCRQQAARLKAIHWALDQFAQAKFSLDPGEALVMAVACRWDQEGKDDPEGILYLTNRRILFERKEKVATKKILFITTASELVQQVLIDQPLKELQSCKAENKGLFGHQDYLLAQFSDPQLAAVALHINGQASADWLSWIERARSGQIESERSGGGSGISISDLTRPLTPADILTIQGQVNALQDEMMLKGPRQELEALGNDTSNLERKLAGVRSRGYLIEKNLEADLAILLAQWSRVKTNTEATIDYQSRQLNEQMQSIQHSMAQLASQSGNLAAARPLYMQLKSALASAEAQAEAAEATVLAQYDPYADEVESLQAHLEWVDWMLDALETASFRLLATESGVAAVEAVYQHPGLEPENGILFLTDQRLLWEDRVDTYELKVNLPHQQVSEVRKESQASAETGEQTWLVFQFGPQAPLPSARFLLSLPVADDWLAMVGRARSGGYAEDRAVPISPEELDRIRAAPQQCPNCGAVFTAPILRGQAEIQCEYCSNIVRI